MHVLRQPVSAHWAVHELTFPAEPTRGCSTSLETAFPAVAMRDTWSLPVSEDSRALPVPVLVSSLVHAGHRLLRLLFVRAAAAGGLFRQPIPLATMVTCRDRRIGRIIEVAVNTIFRTHWLSFLNARSRALPFGRRSIAAVGMTGSPQSHRTGRVQRPFVCRRTLSVLHKSPTAGERKVRANANCHANSARDRHEEPVAMPFTDIPNSQPWVRRTRAACHRIGEGIGPGKLSYSQ